MITVIICTYNPNLVYLTRVLGALKNQTLTYSLWELILVDNNSSSKFASSIDINWHPNSKIISEKKPGLTSARLKGINEALGDILIFVDDDNILANDFLEKSLEIGEKWPVLGVWGGNISPEFEVEPEEWTKDFWYYLAIRQIDKSYWANDISCSKAEPCGAGLCVRMIVAKQYSREISQNKSRLSLDRIGDKLISGGDTDIVLTSLDLGYGMGVFKDLSLVHIMPKERLTERYLVKLMEGLKYSHIILHFFRTKGSLLPPKGIKWWIKHSYNLAILKGRNKRFYLAKTKAEDEAFKFIQNF